MCEPDLWTAHRYTARLRGWAALLDRASEGRPAIARRLLAGLAAHWRAKAERIHGYYDWRRVG